MSAPIIYRFDDANAPVASGTTGAMVALLTACLVTGYGDKPGAGWTREYVNAEASVAAFRNNPITGTGVFLQVDGASAQYAYRPLLQGFEAMTSLEDGIGPFFSAPQNTFFISQNASTTSRPWVLVADDRAFWLTVWGGQTTAPVKASVNKNDFAFGDAVAYYPEDKWFAFMTTGGTAYNTGFKSRLYHSGAADAGYINMPRALSGAPGYVSAVLARGGGPGATYYMGNEGMAYKAGDPVFLTRPYLCDGTATANAAYTFRGWLPGLWYPCQINPFEQLARVEIEGKSYLAIVGNLDGASNSGTFLLSLDDWRK